MNINKKTSDELQQAKDLVKKLKDIINNNIKLSRFEIMDI